MVAPVRNYGLEKNHYFYSIIFLNNIKLVESRKYFFLFKVFILPPLKLC